LATTLTSALATTLTSALAATLTTATLTLAAVLASGAEGRLDGEGTDGLLVQNELASVHDDLSLVARTVRRLGDVVL
jgi:hypothetical protein